MQIEWDHFINGQFVAPARGGRLQSRDPRSGEPAFRVASGSSVDVDRAVEAACQALQSWRSLRPLRRGRILVEIARLMRSHGEELVEVERRETGKPLHIARADLEIAAQYFEFYGGLAPSLEGETINLGPEYHAYTVREPFGVLGVILPFNAPINQAGRGIAPALAAGNTVVAKPSEFTSVSLLALARLATEQAGLPPGVLNVVTGTGRDVGERVVAHPAVRKVTFTGSLRAGRDIGHAAAERIIPLTLELGGKSANLVFEDADLDQAVNGSLAAFTVNAGQICVAGSRCLVQSPIKERFIRALAARASAISVEAADGAGMGPMITEMQYEKVQEFFARAANEGAHAAAGGVAGMHNMPDAGWFVPATVYADVDPDSYIAREEVFGPVVTVMGFDTEEEAVRMANDSSYGLAAGLWTRDLSRAHRVASRLEVGQVFVNEYPSGSVETPFGGYKQSGYGREKGLEALRHYSQVKSVIVRL